MKASLDTNAIIHFYRAGLENILFEFFDEGVFIYEQIRTVELNHHGQDVLDRIDSDILSGKMEVYTDHQLKEQAVYRIFEKTDACTEPGILERYTRFHWPRHWEPTLW